MTWLSRLGRVLQRAEVLALAGALVLFAAGAFNVCARRQGARPAIGGPSPTERPGIRVGPVTGEPLAPYIARKKQLLADRSVQAPKARSYAVLSFTTYQHAQASENFSRGLSLEVAEIHLRIPLPGLQPSAARVRGSIVETVAAEAARIRSDLETELATLEDIIPTLRSRADIDVYQEDVKRIRDALAILDGDPALVFALVGRTSHETLAAAGRDPGVRLVDLPEDAGATLDTHDFIGLTPEETETAR